MVENLVSELCTHSKYCFLGKGNAVCCKIPLYSIANETLRAF